MDLLPRQCPNCHDEIWAVLKCLGAAVSFVMKDRYLLSPQSPRLDCQTLASRITVAADSRIRKLKMASSAAPANPKGADCSKKFSKHRTAALTISAHASVFPDAQMNTTASRTAAGASALD